jgi:hypothetical protein
MMRDDGEIPVLFSFHGHLRSICQKRMVLPWAFPSHCDSNSTRPSRNCSRQMAGCRVLGFAITNATSLQNGIRLLYWCLRRVPRVLVQTPRVSWFSRVEKQWQETGIVLWSRATNIRRTPACTGNPKRVPNPRQREPGSRERMVGRGRCLRSSWRSKHMLRASAIFFLFVYPLC